MILRPAWGGKNFTGPLWPNPLAPEWAQTAARRMHDSKVPVERINEILAEMRKVNVRKVYTLDTLAGKAEYEVIFE